MEYALANGAHVLVLRAGPVRGPGFSRTPGDPVYDGVWARIAEAGILAAYHSGDAGYNRYADEWAMSTVNRGGDFQAFRNDPFRSVTSGHRPIYDTIAGCTESLCYRAEGTITATQSGNVITGALSGVLTYDATTCPASDHKVTFTRQ